MSPEQRVEILMEEFLSFPNMVTVADGNTSYQLTSFLRSLVVSEENIRYIYLIISKALRSQDIDNHFHDPTYIQSGSYTGLNDDLFWLRNNVDTNNYIKEDSFPQIIACMDSIRWLILLTLNSMNLILSESPPIYSYRQNQMILASRICWRVQKNTSFSIIMEKINPWSEYDV